MKCPNCGTEFFSRFCPDCGFKAISKSTMDESNEENSLNANLNEESDQEMLERPIPKKANKRKLIIISVSVVALAIVAFCVYKGVEFYCHQKKVNWLKSQFSSTSTTDFNGIKLKIPKQWEQSNDDPAILFYKYADDGTLLAGGRLYEYGIDIETLDAKEVLKKFIPEGATHKNTGDKKINNEETTYQACTHVDKDGEYKWIGYCIKADNSCFVYELDTKSEYYSDDTVKMFTKNIDVSNYSTPSVASLDVTYNGPTKRNVSIDRDSDGITVTANYDNGFAQDVTSRCNVFGPTLVADKTSTYSVTYEGAIKKFDVKCSSKLKKIIAAYNGDTDAGVKIDNNSDGLTVTAIYNDGEENITSKCKFNTIELKAGETSSTTIKYESKQCELSVECSTITEAQYKEQCSSYSYSEIAHYPEKYEGKKIHFSGKVLQVTDNAYRIAMNGNYDTVVFVEDERAWAPSNLGLFNENYQLNELVTGGGSFKKGNNDSDYGGNIIEDDWVSVYGECNGTTTYTSVLGASITIPSIKGYYISRS